MHAKTSCCLVVPCFNEQGKIYNAVKQLSVFYSQNSNIDWFLILVDDGSTDKSKEEIFKSIKDFDSTFDNFKVESVFLDKNQGKGAAIQAGLKSKKADFYCYFDVDLSIDYKKAIPDAIKLSKDNDLIMGQRSDFGFSGYGKIRNMGSSFFNFISRYFFGLRYKDIQCGFKFFNNKAKNFALATERSRFSFDLEFLLRSKKEKLKIISLPVDWEHKEGSSVSWQDALRYFLDLILISEIVYSKKTWNIIYFTLVSVLTFLLFGWVIWGGYFFSDDFTWVWHGYKILSGQITVLGAHMSTFYSPVLNAFYAFSVGVFGLSTWWYFFFGLVVHALNCYLVAILGRELSNSAVVGFLAGLLFVLVGGAYEPLIWVGANMHSIAVLFMLLSVLFLLFRLKGGKGYGFLFLSLVFLVFAFGTKEISIITPFLLGGIFIYHKSKIKTYFNKVDIMYWLVVVGTSLFYAFKQYLAQQGSVWVSSGALSFSPKLILRFPLALVDVFIPLSSFLSENTAWVILLFCLVIVSYLIYKFYKNKLVIFGLYWSILSIGTVVFFNYINWWEVLPSRYTYSVRVGVVLVLAAVFVDLIRKSRYLRVVQGLFWVLVCMIFFQLYNMANIINLEYSYVYNTGKTLVVAVEEIKRVGSDKIFVEWERPFERNFAHVVGLLEYVAQIPESNVVFLSKEDEYILQDGEVSLRWDMKKEEYQVIYK